MTMEDRDLDAIIIEDETLRNGFTMIPNTVLRWPNISMGAKVCYGMLLSYAWQKDYCYPGQERLSNDLHVSDRQIRTYLVELEREGFITVHQRGLHKTNLYTLHKLPTMPSGQ